MSEIRKLRESEREAIHDTWNGVKFRHPGVDVRSEWDRYTAWRKRKDNFEPKHSIKSIIDFENLWLKSVNVKRFKNPTQFKEKEKEISLADIQSVFDMLSKRKLQITESEIRTLLTKGVSVVAVELWFQNGLMPKHPAFKSFLASKGRY